MREHAASESPVALPTTEREGIEPRRDLALEPRLVALARMLACPAAIAAMPLADRLASRAVHGGTAARIVARGAWAASPLARDLRLGYVIDSIMTAKPNKLH